MKKKTPEKILDDVLENLTDWDKDVENVGKIVNKHILRI